MSTTNIVSSDARFSFKVKKPRKKEQYKNDEVIEYSKSFAKKVYECLFPYINKYDPGKLMDGIPKHTITKQTRHEWNCFKNRPPKNAIEAEHSNRIRRKFYASVFSWQKMLKHQSRDEKHHYTSWNKNRFLAMFDYDTHNGEDDLHKAMQLVRRFWPEVYEDDSERGGHGYAFFTHKNGIETNAIMAKAKEVLSNFLDFHGVLTEFEIKGTATVPNRDKEYNELCGSLATVPYVSPDTYEQLDHLAANPIDVRLFELKLEALEEWLAPHQTRIANNRAIRLAKAKAYKTGTQYVEPMPVEAKPAIVASRLDLCEAEATQRMSNRQRAVARLSKDEVSLLYDHWQLGQEDAYKRDSHLTGALFRQLNTVLSVDEVLQHKEQCGCFTGEFNEKKALNRLSAIVPKMAESFKPLTKTGSGFPVINICERARKSIHQAISGNIIRDREGFDDSGMPTKDEYVLKYVTVDRDKARLLFSVILDCVNKAAEGNEGVATSFVEQTYMAQGKTDWNFYEFEIVRNWMEDQQIIDIYDKNHSAGKCWRWRLMEKAKKVWKGFVKRITTQNLLKPSTLVEVENLTDTSLIKLHQPEIPRPPD